MLCDQMDWKKMMLAHGDGRRRRRRPRRKWMYEMHEVTGMKLAELRDVTTESKIWRNMVMTARDDKITLKEYVGNHNLAAQYRTHA